MKLYKKEGNIIQIISFPKETVEKGDYLLVEDSEAAKALIVQVIDVQFASVPGVLEELLRSLPDGGELIQGEDFDPLEIASHITYIQDASLIVCKIRATVEKDSLSPSSSWLPSRSKSTVKKLPLPTLQNLVNLLDKTFNRQCLLRLLNSLQKTKLVMEPVNNRCWIHYVSRYLVFAAVLKLQHQLAVELVYFAHNIVFY